MSLINAKTRFAVEEDTGKLFCYLTARHLEPTGIHEASDGHWDLAKVKHAILNGLHIHTALVEPPPSEDKVAQANADFSAAVEAEIAKRKAEQEAVDAAKGADPATPAPEAPAAAAESPADAPAEAAPAA
jgi:hypothetical protein